jgi:hypothetical protein
MRYTSSKPGNFRQKRSVQPLAATAPAAKPTDLWLQRLASASQLGVLALGIFGYFYTVLPVFQNQELQEQAAKLELEKSLAEKQLDSLKLQQNNVTQQIYELQQKWSQERNRNENLVSAATDAEQKEMAALQKRVEAENRLRIQDELFEKARWELVFLDFTLSEFGTKYNKSISSWQSRSDSPGEFITASDTSWPQPLDELLSAADAAERRANSRKDIPGTYYEELKRLIKARESELKCAKPDLKAMHIEYLAEIAALDPVIDAELNRYIDNLRGTYAAKKQRVEITDEFRDASRRSIRVGKAFEVDQKYRKRIDALQKPCEDTEAQVMDEIRHLKGATR